MRPGLQTRLRLPASRLAATTALAALLLSLPACQPFEDLQGFSVETGPAEFAVPLFSGSVSIQDLLENFDEYTFVEITPDGIIHLRYKGDVLSQQAEEFFLDAREKIPPLIPLESRLYPLPFSAPEQLEVDFATYRSGTIGLALISDHVGTVDLTVTILQSKKDGVPMQLHTQFESPVGAAPIFFHYPPEVVDAKGYDLQPDNGTLWIRYDAVTESGDTIDLPFIALVNKDIDFSYLEGYLGNFKHKGKRDSIAIEFFENWIQGDVYFENPVIQIHIQNAFGVPTRSSIDVFDIITADGLRIPLESEFITASGIDFVYPANNEVGAVKEMTFTFDAANSNIEEVLGSRPIALDYKVDAVMNPDSLTGERGFITDSSFYRIQVEVDLPLQGRASGFVISDSYDISLDSYGDIESAEFKLVADNSMPLGINAQLYFVDENGLTLDSLFEQRKDIVAAAPVDAAGLVVERRTATNLAPFSAERFQRIRTAKRLLLSAGFSTSGEGSQTVRALSDQSVDIRMGMKVNTRP
ncbi:MAG: hypothetical protein RLY31_870 [Bacteroidota bacterium]|jgi:hypothetical protein